MNNIPRPALAMGLSLAIALHLFLLLAGVCLGAPIPEPSPTGIPTPTRTAIDAGGTFPLPNMSTSFGFENPAGWTFSGSAGIASNGSPYTGVIPAPQGTKVAYLTGTQSSVVCTGSFASATWRLHIFAAQKTASDTQTLRVTVGGTKVAEGEPAGTSFDEITTRPFTSVSSTTPVEIRFEGLTAGETLLIDSICYERVFDWNSTITWGGTTAPTATDNVSIPSTARVAISGTNCVAATVGVQGSLQVSSTNSSLAARWVMVSGPNGVFEVGTEGCPFLQNFTLTLTGSGTIPDPNDPTKMIGENIMGAGSKFLMAMGGGQIDLHGKPHYIDFAGQPQRSWVNLSGNALPNATTIRTNRVVDWASGTAGDTIVIAPSTLPTRTRVTASGTRDVTNSVEAIDAEIRTISINDTTTKTLTLAPAMPPGGTLSPGPLQYKHQGFTYSSTRPLTVIPATSSTLPLKPWTVDERAEVGLLTHNVVVQGEILTPAQENLGFGGHVMIMKMPKSSACSCCATNGGGIGRFSNVEFYRMGQKQRIGRYPIHWHMLGDDGAGQYAMNCSIWHSYNRAITLHGTSNVEIVGNVAYDHIGHGIFLEDGSERGNIIEYNLALGTIRPPAGQELLPTDNSEADILKRFSPATYWITNPNNTFIGNVAAGTIGNGFWFPLPQNSPLGLSMKTYTSGTTTAYEYPGLQNIVPNTELLGTFQSNVAHSNTIAITLNDSINMDVANPTDTTKQTLINNVGWKPEIPAVLTNFQCYSNNVALYTGHGGGHNDRITFDNAILADNYNHIFLAAYNTVQNSLVVAETGSQVLPSGTLPRFAYLVYDGAGRVLNSHFVGFGPGNPNNASLLKNIGGAQRHTNHLFGGVTFDHTGTKPTVALDDFTSIANTGTSELAHSGIWSMSIRDLDGTLTGTANRTLISNHPMMRTSGDIAWSGTIPNNPSNAWISNKKFGNMRVSLALTGTDLQRPIIEINELLPNVTISRTGTGSDAAEVDYINNFHIANGNDPSLVALHKKHGKHQLAVVVTGPGNTYNSFTYTWKFTRWPSIAQGLILNVDDLVEGDISPLICLKDVGKIAGLTVTAATSSTSLNALMTMVPSGTANSKYYNTGTDLYLRLVAPPLSPPSPVSTILSVIKWTGTFDPQ